MQLPHLSNYKYYIEYLEGDAFISGQFSPSLEFVFTQHILKLKETTVLQDVLISLNLVLPLCCNIVFITKAVTGIQA
jgi:hypothetical protein